MRRTTKAGAAAASLALLLAACSSGSETATEGSAPASSAPAASSGTFTIWADETRTPPIQAECNKFAEANGITCDVVQIDFGDIRARAVQGSQTGDVPDVFIGAHDWLGELVTNGVVAPVDLGANSASFSDPAVKGVTYDGKTYGVPYAVENIAMLTNPKLSPECPASLDDLQAAGKKLKDDGDASLPLALQIGDQGDAYHWYPLYSADGGYIFGDGGTNVDDMGVGQEGSIKAAERLQAFADDGLLKASVTGDIANESYTSGKSAWWITGPWNANAAVEGVPDTKVCPVPNGDSTSTPFIGVQTFFIPTKAKNALIAQTYSVHRRADVLHPHEGQERPDRADVPERLRHDDGVHGRDVRRRSAPPGVDRVRGQDHRPDHQGLHRVRQAGHPPAVRPRDGFCVGVAGPGRVQGCVG